MSGSVYALQHCATISLVHGDKPKSPLIPLWPGRIFSRIGVWSFSSIATPRVVGITRTQSQFLGYRIEADYVYLKVELLEFIILRICSGSMKALLAS